MSIIKHFKLTVILLGIVGIILYPYYKLWKMKTYNEKVSLTLKDNEKRKIIIEDRTITNVEKDKIEVKSGARTTVITVKNDGSIDLYSPTIGFICEPGYATFYSNEKLWVGLDIQWFYWRRIGLLSGIGLRSENHDLKGKINVLSLSYTMPFKILSNTSMYIGLNDSTKFLAGIRVKW